MKLVLVLVLACCSCAAASAPPRPVAATPAPPVPRCDAEFVSETKKLRCSRDAEGFDTNGYYHPYEVLVPFAEAPR